VHLALALLTATLILTGCDRRDKAARPLTDAEIRKTLPGQWSVVISNVEGGLTLRPDGTYSGYWSNLVTPAGWRSEGYWQIANGALISRITNKSAWNFTLSGPTGTVERVKILRLTDQELTTATHGRTNKWTRKQ
jgi:hypothetical protein